VNEYTAEMAKIILEKLQAKGWNLYKALEFADTVDPTETIRRGPAFELEQDAMYILLPMVEDNQSPAAVQDALRKLTKKTGGHVFLPHGEEGISLQALILREGDVCIPAEKNRKIGIPYTSFVDQLDRLYDTNLKHQINYANIAAPLRTLVQKLNDVPFVYTLKSRAGRITDIMKRDFNENPLTDEEKKSADAKMCALPDEDKAFITSGYIKFRLTGAVRDPTVGAFMQEVYGLAEKYSFVKLKCKGTNWTIVTDAKDMTDAHEVVDDDDFETRVKKLHQASKKKAEKRMKDFLEVRDVLIEIAERYAPKEE